MSRIIKGKTKDGTKFRPSGWAEMLVSSDEEGKICIIVCEEGNKCIRVCKTLDGSEEAERLIQFAIDNDLIVEEVTPNEKSNK